MSSNQISNDSFVICVREPDPRNQKHVLIHPVLLVGSDETDEPVSPESVIEGFKMPGSFQNRKLIAIHKTQVSAGNWNLLMEGVKDSEICAAGIKVRTGIFSV